MTVRRGVLFILFATLSACKIELTAPPEGGVTTSSGAISCAANQLCDVNVTDIYFDETFVAAPAPGWHFDGWRQRHRGLCGGNKLACRLRTSGFAGNDVLMSFLNNPDETFYLEPEFVVERRTDEIELAAEDTESAFGFDWELDFYRNSSYSCGASGNYTFMVMEPGNNPGAEAPLWVYLHGGGVGYYANDGTYYAPVGQTEDTWNNEESFDDFRINQLRGRTLQGGQPKDITLTRRIQEGYRILFVSMCDQDQYSGLGTPYPNNPGSTAEVNGLQATMAAVEYTVANYPTSHVVAHGTSAGSTGAYSLATAFAAENVFLTAAVPDSTVITPRLETVINAFAGTQGFPFPAGFDPQGVIDKLGFYAEEERLAYPEARISGGFTDVPMLFLGGDADPFCAGNQATIFEAQSEGVNNCDYVYNGLRQAIDAQQNSPHQISILDGVGHIPSNTVSAANDIVDAFIGNVLNTSPPLPFRTTRGFDALFIGHSFFVPIADEIPFHTVRAGVDGHTQITEFSGGASGAPMALWQNAGHRSSIQAVLDTGNVELFGMTYEPTHPGTEGYELWIDYALSKNPNTRFFIGLPWLDFPGDYPDAATYAGTWQSAHDVEWHLFIDSLRALYPGVEIFCMPYGQAALELRTLMEAGDLPEASVLTGEQGVGLFRDNKGHGHSDGVLLDLAELIWISAIYGIDLDDYAYDPGYVTDIKAIAKAIMDAHDPLYNKR